MLVVKCYVKKKKLLIEMIDINKIKKWSNKTIIFFCTKRFQILLYMNYTHVHFDK